MITHVSVRNYKSLADVEVDLGPLTVLVGQNSTGKSNFADVLRFVSDAVNLGLDRAVVDRGGIGSIRRYSKKGRPFHISISLQFDLNGQEGEFAFTLAGEHRHEYSVRFEKCLIAGQGYEVRNGELSFIGYDRRQTPANIHLTDATALALPVYRTLELLKPIRQVGDYLVNAAHYTIFPNTLREPRKPTADLRLYEDGFNIGSMLRRLQREASDRFEIIKNALNNVVPDIVGIDVQQVGGFLVIKLMKQYDRQVNEFDLSQESDGTLRLLGILTALYQVPTPSLITFEEPELTVHPGVLGILSDIIKEASLRSQIVITTHSPDFISRFDPTELRVVEKVEGMTKIAPMEQGQLEAVRQKLFSAGELLLIEGLRRQTQT